MSDSAIEQHLTLGQLADRLQVSVDTVRWWIKHGTAPKRIKVGRHIRFRLADVTAWEDKLVAK